MEEFLTRLIAPNNMISLAVTISALLLWVAVRKGFTAYDGANRGKNRSSVAQTMYDLIKYSILLGTVLTVLQINHVNVTSMVAGLGLASAIVGLALQDLLKDSIMGIHMLTDRFFEVGDVVRYGSFEGVVISFNIKTTKLQSIYDNSVMTICNRNISEIVRCSNWSDIDIPLSYKENAEAVHALLEDICLEISQVEGMEDCQYKGTQDFIDSATLYKIRLFCPPEQSSELRRKALRIIQTRLAEAGIRIPYRQVDIHQCLERWPEYSER